MLRLLSHDASEVSFVRILKFRLRRIMLDAGWSTTSDSIDSMWSFLLEF